MNVAEVLEGRFELRAVLGEGGMGQVFKAWDRDLDRFVAVKTLLSQFISDPAAAQDMKREVKLAQRLTHEGIVAVYDYRVHERTPYIVMELVEGQDLLHVIWAQPGNRLEAGAFHALAELILAGVGYAHRQGVIHRDLKPENIMVLPGGHIKLMDFGIAAAVQANYTRMTGRTSSLSVAYASPEQINGEHPAPSMDIYSLGCVFYAMLCGHPPFYQGEILHQQLNREPPPLEGVSAELNAAVLSCLVKDPGRRLRSVEEVRAAVAGQRTVRIPRAAPSLRPSVAPRPSETPPAARPISARREASASDQAPVDVAGPPGRPFPAAPPAPAARGQGVGDSSVSLVPALAGAGALAAVAIGLVVLLRPSIEPAHPLPSPTMAPARTPEQSRLPDVPQPVATPSPPPPEAVLDVRPNAAGTTITVNKERPVPGPAELRVSAGTHWVEVSKPGCSTSRQWVEVSGGERRRLEIALSCALPTPPPAQARLERAPVPASPPAPTHNSDRETLALARTALEAGDYATAEGAYRRMLANDSANVEARRGLEEVARARDAERAALSGLMPQGATAATAPEAKTQRLSVRFVADMPYITRMHRSCSDPQQLWVDRNFPRDDRLIDLRSGQSTALKKEQKPTFGQTGCHRPNGKWSDGELHESSPGGRHRVTFDKGSGVVAIDGLRVAPPELKKFYDPQWVWLDESTLAISHFGGPMSGGPGYIWVVRVE